VKVEREAEDEVRRSWLFLCVKVAGASPGPFKYISVRIYTIYRLIYTMCIYTYIQRYI
jgi:hypothetical protein